MFLVIFCSGVGDHNIDPVVLTSNADTHRAQAAAQTGAPIPRVAAASAAQKTPQAPAVN